MSLRPSLFFERFPLSTASGDDIRNISKVRPEMGDISEPSRCVVGYGVR